MVRRIAVVLGLVWTILLGSLLISELGPYLRTWRWPSGETWKTLLPSVLLYGTMAFVCFALSAALNGNRGKESAAEEPEDREQ